MNLAAIFSTASERSEAHERRSVSEFPLSSVRRLREKFPDGNSLKPLTLIQAAVKTTSVTKFPEGSLFLICGYSMSARFPCALIVAVSLAVVSPAMLAGDKHSPKEFTSALEKIPAAELPAAAAGLVAKAPENDREATAEAVVKAAVGLNPASAPAIVGAIARAVPDVAATAAKVAAELQPKQAGAIARAAAAGAPEKAGKIVESVCRVVPPAYREVASFVAQVAPKANAEILDGVALALPSMKGAIVQSQSRAGSGSSVDAILQAANPPQPTTPPMPTVSGVRGPSIGGAFVPLPGGVTNAPPSGGNVPPGGRNYARP